MNLLIRVFADGENFVAVCAPSGALWSAGACGGGSSERSAVQEAINSYFKRKEEQRLAEHQPFIDPVAPAPVMPQPALTQDVPFQPLSDEIFSVNVAVDPEGFERLLSAELERGPVEARDAFTLHYEDRNGVSTVRSIRPWALGHRASSVDVFPRPYLVAEDLSNGERRTFYLERMKRLERQP